MYKQSIKKIIDYLDRDEYDNAIEVCTFALMETKKSEERLAVIYLMNVATKKDPNLTELVVMLAHGDISIKNFI